MYEPVESIRVDQTLLFRHGKTIEDQEDEETDQYLEERRESTAIRSEQALENGFADCGRARKKPPKPVKYKWTGDARERRDAKIYAGQVARDGTLTPKQKEVVTDLANGYLLRSIAKKHHLTNGGIIYHLREARERLGALSNPNLVKIAVQRGLI